MKIRERDLKHYVPLEHLKAGDTFELLGIYYLKTDCGFNNDISCVRISDGHIASIAMNKAVTPINMECTISGEEDKNE